LRKNTRAGETCAVGEASTRKLTEYSSACPFGRLTLALSASRHWSRAKGAPRTRNVILASLRFLFEHTLERPEVVAGIRRAKVQPTVPTVLSGTELHELIGSIRSVAHRAMVSVLYGAGLWVSEMYRLRIEDIDSQRMQLRIVEGKNGDRYVRLAPSVLEALEAKKSNAFAAGQRPLLVPPRARPSPHRSRSLNFHRELLQHAPSCSARQPFVADRLSAAGWRFSSTWTEFEA
jgi:integrase